MILICPQALFWKGFQGLSPPVEAQASPEAPSSPPPPSSLAIPALPSTNSKINYARCERISREYTWQSSLKPKKSYFGAYSFILEAEGIHKTTSQSSPNSWEHRWKNELPKAMIFNRYLETDPDLCQDPYWVFTLCFPFSPNINTQVEKKVTI